MYLYIIHIDSIQPYCRFQPNILQTACCFEPQFFGWFLVDSYHKCQEIWIEVCQASRLLNWRMCIMGFHVLTLFQQGGWNPHPSRFFPRPRHKNQLIDSKLSDFSLLLSRHKLTKNQVHSLSRGDVITLLSEALCFITYLSLYFHRIFMFYFFFLLTFIFSVN